MINDGFDVAFASLKKTAMRILWERNRAFDLLTEIEEFLADYSDVVDGSYGESRPNKAMQLITEIKMLKGEL